MIIVRSPLRISLAGGGTDLPSYYQKSEGLVLSAAVDKYVYVTVTRPFKQGIFLKYSEIENVRRVEEIRHPFIREALKNMNLKTPQIEITSLADIPAGTGLGSSGSFSTALLKALYAHYRKDLQTKDLAELACEIEMEKLNLPVGKQDQYIAAYGGLCEFVFNRDKEVQVSPLEISMKTTHQLEDNLLLFYTGLTRKASAILQDQNRKTHSRDSNMLKNLDQIKQLAKDIKNSLLEGRTEEFGKLMHEHWSRKRERTKGITNEFIDMVYHEAIQNGAIGGKLVGAGGGGFLMFYASDSEKLRNCMERLELSEVRFRFDFEGTKILLS